MYADTYTSNRIGRLSGKLLDTLTELGARRDSNEDHAYVRPSDYGQFQGLCEFLNKHGFVSTSNSKD